MGYIPHTDQDRAEMLATIGVKSLEDLFEAVPEKHRFPDLNLPEPLSEMEIMRELAGVTDANFSADQFSLFLGAGAYHHFVPSIVGHMLMRGEFLTAYTPYQPEVSQGTLQVIYEFQSMITVLTGMEAANASHYDGATALAESLTLAFEVHRGKRRKVVFANSLHPMYRAVARTYHQHRGLNFVEADMADLKNQIDDETMVVALQSPDFFGRIHDYGDLVKAAQDKGALVVVATDPLACALIKPPGAYGVDVVVGEGQPLGIPLSFGGPYLGFFATRMKHIRKIAGRIVGETADSEGRKAFVMTLRPREQDIRREKATSNICTNQGLMATAACIYMSAMGKHGMRKVAELCWHKSHYAADQIAKVPGYSVQRDQPFIKEFVVKCPKPVQEINEALAHDYGIVGGYDLSRDYPDRRNEMLVCVTEMNTKEEIDALVEALRELNH